MKDFILYYPLSSVNLSHVFAKAIILPASLYENRIEDLQSEFVNAVLLTQKLGCSECDCCLEILLLESEHEFLQEIQNGFYLYKQAIPISRIKRILFASTEQRSTTIKNIELSTAYIPKHIVETKTEQFDDTKPDRKDCIVELTNEFKKISDNAKFFDHILGALALDNTVLFEDCNYASRYTDLLASLNKKIRKEKESAGRSINISSDFFSNIPTKTPYLLEGITEDIIRTKNSNILPKNNITNVIELDKLTNDDAYICAIAYSYGVESESKRKRIDELIIRRFQNHEDIRVNQSEKVALYYGLNRGYAAFNKSYSDGEIEVPVKYKMNSLLDYYTIESVFNYAFNHTVADELLYLNKIAPKNKPQKPQREEYIILDVVVRDKKKLQLFSKEWCDELFPSLFQNIETKIFGVDIKDKVIEKILQPLVDKIRIEVEEQRKEIIHEYEDKVKALDEKIEEQNQKIQQLESIGKQEKKKNQRKPKQTIDKETSINSGNSNANVIKNDSVGQDLFSDIQK